jgi:hypothetical protein
VGILVGYGVVGSGVGYPVGYFVGEALGYLVGTVVGYVVGYPVGVAVSHDVDPAVFENFPVGHDYKPKAYDNQLKRFYVSDLN